MRVALASDPRVQAPMEAVLRRGNAADAVVCGLFAAAAVSPSVLLGPAQVLVGGTGAGLRAIDGRARQPGLGAKRPRGFKDDEAVAPAARVAVPGLPAAALVAHAAHGKAPMGVVSGAVLPLARAASAARASVLERVLGAGAVGLAKERELFAAAGPIAGGLLTAEDLAAPPAVVDCATEEDAGWTVARAPWAPTAPRGRVGFVLAADGRGMLAVACYEIADEGLEIEALGLIAPALADPVRRGVARTAPGEPLATACPIALGLGEGFVLAVGAPEEAILVAALDAARGSTALPDGALGVVFSSKKARSLPTRA